MPAFILSVIRDFHKHPLFNAAVALCLAALAYFVIHYTARASDFEDLQAKVTVLSNDVDNIKIILRRDKLEERIFDLETQIFGLEELQRDGSITAEQLGRLGDLRSTLNQKQRDLARVPDIKE